jgi:hypothetical protein
MEPVAYQTCSMDPMANIEYILQCIHVLCNYGLASRKLVPRINGIQDFGLNPLIAILLPVLELFCQNYFKRFPWILFTFYRSVVFFLIWFWNTSVHTSNIHPFHGYCSDDGIAWHVIISILKRSIKRASMFSLPLLFLLLSFPSSN